MADSDVGVLNQDDSSVAPVSTITVTRMINGVAKQVAVQVIAPCGADGKIFNFAEQINLLRSINKQLCIQSVILSKLLGAVDHGQEIDPKDFGVLLEGWTPDGN